MPGPGTWSAGDVLTAADLNAIGTWTSYTPTLTQNGTRTATVNYAKYVTINDFTYVVVDLTCTNTGTTSNLITVSVPVTIATASTVRTLGTGFFYDSSGTDVQLLTVIPSGGSAVRFLTEASTSRASGEGLGVSPAVALGNGDVLSFTLIYE